MSAFSVACDAIKAAGSERDVVLAVQRFLASLTQSERNQLPWGLLARQLANVGDVALWALQLVAEQVGADDVRPGPAYGQAAEILKRAAARLVELRRTEA